MKWPREDDIRAARAAQVILRTHGQLFAKLGLHRATSKLLGDHGTTDYRNRFSRLQTQYSSELLHGISAELGIQTNFTFDGIDPSGGNPGPMIVVSNHQSTIDIIVLYEALRHLEASVRWVMKSELKGTPWGWAGVETNAAFVDRDGGDADIPAILACGQSAYKDRAAVVIFPEGTRFKPSKQVPEFTHLLPPRFGGFSALCDAAPEADVLSVTLHWSGGSQGLGFGQAFQDVKGLIGRTLDVHAELVPRRRVELGRKAWLHREWKKKEEELTRLEAA